MKALTTIIKGLSILTGATALAGGLPPKYAPIAAVVFAVASFLKDIAYVVGDYLDDKQLNKSFNPEATK